jgi:hypothetical protein
MPVVVPVMMMVMVSVVVMVVVPVATPHTPAVAMTVTPMMIADPEPRNIVDHIGVLDSRLHRRRSDDCRTRVRRHQCGARHGHRRRSQAQKQLAHRYTSWNAFTHVSARYAHSRHVAHARTLRARSNRLAVWRIQSRFNDAATSRRRRERILQGLDSTGVLRTTGVRRRGLFGAFCRSIPMTWANN